MQPLFAHLSDPHLTSLDGVRGRQLINKRLLGYLSWVRRRRFAHCPEVLAAMQRDLEFNPVELLLITGDLTNVGLPAEFRQASTWLQQLGKPHDVAVVPGNHDAYVKTRWDESLALWDAYMRSDDATTAQFPSLRVRSNVAFIGVSTSCPTPPLMATGTVGTDQLQRLAQQLVTARAKGLFRVIYLHHSPLVATEKWRKRLTDAPALQELIQKHGAELVLHGHGHRAHDRELQTQHGALPVIAVPSASAVGYHGAEVASYNRCAVSKTDAGWSIDIESRGYDNASGQFTTRGRRSIDLARD
jgi:3',5'-cyclic AMP phosphodiesterase CpdA